MQKPAIEYLKPLVSDLVLALAVALGLFVLMIGAIVEGVADTSGGREAGQVVASIGLFILTAIMLVGGLIRVDMEKWVRVVLIFGAVLLIAWVGFW